jgi:hypothetical protein
VTGVKREKDEGDRKKRNRPESFILEVSER